MLWIRESEKNRSESELRPPSDFAVVRAVLVKGCHDCRSQNHRDKGQASQKVQHETGLQTVWKGPGGLPERKWAGIQHDRKNNNLKEVCSGIAEEFRLVCNWRNPLAGCNGARQTDRVDNQVRRSEPREF
jgi:hypothetical protein